MVAQLIEQSKTVKIIFCRWLGDARSIGSARYGKERQQVHDVALEICPNDREIKEPVNQMLGEYMRVNDLVRHDSGAGELFWKRSDPGVAAVISEKRRPVDCH